jgi:hypothetical protein
LPYSAIKKVSNTAIGKKDFKHMRWVGNNLIKNKRFVGIILYTGNTAVSFGDNLWAIPFGLIWS